jgi:C-terminal processing protease CtpA/Prc
MISRIPCVLVIALLLSSLQISGQTEIIVYDGYTGIYNVSIRNDTASITTLLPGSPAEKAGVRFRDQIIAINDSLISGHGFNQRMIQDLLRNRSGEPVDLQIKRKGVDSLLHYSFCREPYLHQIAAF